MHKSRILIIQTSIVWIFVVRATSALGQRKSRKAKLRRFTKQQLSRCLPVQEYLGATLPAPHQSFRQIPTGRLEERQNRRKKRRFFQSFFPHHRWHACTANPWSLPLTQKYTPQTQPNHDLAFAEQVVGRRFFPERVCLRSRRVSSEFMVCMEMVKVWQKYGRSVFSVKVTLALVVGD